jgi:hypothetical protein
MMMMYHLLLTFLLLLTSAIAVHSTPLSTTKKFIRRTEEAGEAKKISNDDPDRIDFGFAIQTNSPPADVQRVADALESFGTTLFNTTAEYSYRFMSFEVDPIPSTSIVVSRGSEEQSHSFPFVATLTLDKGTIIDGSAVQEEEVKQFFLNALRNATVSTDTLDDFLLGQWTAVETDAVPQVPLAATTTNTSNYDSINSAVGIAMGVISACLVIFLVAHYKCRSR